MRKRKSNRPERQIHVAKDESSGTQADESSPNVGEGAEAGDGAKEETAENRRSARAFLIGAAQAAVIIPVLFYLTFGEVNAFALAFTGFVVVLCLLVALGYSIPDRPESQTRPARIGALNYVGGFWLVACAFGPFFGWLLTTPEFPLTEGNWWWRYAARAALSVAVPVLTALPLSVYVRGRYWHVALLLLLGLTSLAAWSGLNTLRDLREGPVVRQTTGYEDAANNSFYPSASGKPYKLTMLAHTERTIKIEPATPDATR
jgi:MFS family permease